MTDVFRFRVHGSTHRELCDAADEEIRRYLDEEGPPFVRTAFRVHESRIDATALQLVTGRVLSYTGDVTVILFKPEPDL